MKFTSKVLIFSSTTLRLQFPASIKSTGEENRLSFDVDEEELATSLSIVKELINPVTENVSKTLVLFSTSINGLELEV